MTNWEKQKQELQHWGIQCFDNIPTQFISFLKENINYQNAVNTELAGHMKEEYGYSNWPPEFEKWLIEQSFVRKSLTDYADNLQVLTDNVPFVLQKLWINLQKKYEFNPIHNHGGVFSFIIPLNIPYKLEDEDNYFPKNSFAQHCTSRLMFLVHETLGKAMTIEVNMDKSFENKMMMFPAKLQHQVYPFYTSDEHRITVSGNISLYTGKR